VTSLLEGRDVLVHDVGDVDDVGEVGVVASGEPHSW
jgi:hypothetical protein